MDGARQSSDLGGADEDRVSAFAAELRQLRKDAGNPSFRIMAGRSGCISHTTLHEATIGSRLPSWQTTREFVRACGGDEHLWRSHWEQAAVVTPEPASPAHIPPQATAAQRDAVARQAARLPGTAQPDIAQPDIAQPDFAWPAPAQPDSAHPGPGQVNPGQPGAAQPDPGQPDPGQVARGHVAPGQAGTAQASAEQQLAVIGTGGDEWHAETRQGGNHETAYEPEQPADAARRGWWRRRPVAAVVVAMALAGTVMVVAALLAFARIPQRWFRAPTAPIPGPLVAGDASRFVADITIPDGTRVTVNQPFQKVWAIQNIGSASWHGRYLQRLDLPPGPNTCQTPSRVPIGDTAPGEVVWISVNVVAPAVTGSCWVGWKMVDDSGRAYLPSARPVFFLVDVVSAPGAPGAGPPASSAPAGVERSTEGMPAPTR